MEKSLEVVAWYIRIRVSAKSLECARIADGKCAFIRTFARSAQSSDLMAQGEFKKRSDKFVAKGKSKTSQKRKPIAPRKGGKYQEKKMTTRAPSS